VTADLIFAHASDALKAPQRLDTDGGVDEVRRALAAWRAAGPVGRAQSCAGLPRQVRGTHTRSP
jgi:hypothetical protein